MVRFNWLKIDNQKNQSYFFKQIFEQRIFDRKNQILFLQPISFPQKDHLKKSLKTVSNANPALVNIDYLAKTMVDYIFLKLLDSNLTLFSTLNI